MAGVEQGAQVVVIDDALAVPARAPSGRARRRAPHRRRRSIRRGRGDLVDEVVSVGQLHETQQRCAPTAKLVTATAAGSLPAGVARVCGRPELLVKAIEGHRSGRGQVVAGTEQVELIGSLFSSLLFDTPCAPTVADDSGAQYEFVDDGAEAVTAKQPWARRTTQRDQSLEKAATDRIAPFR